MYVCVWVPGGVVVRPWAHNHKGEFKPGTCPSGDVVQLYSFSITMWCEKSIQHQPTSSPSCKWEPGILGCKFTGHFSYTSLVQVGLRVPTPVAGRDGQSSCEFLARLHCSALACLCTCLALPGERDRLMAAI